MIIAYADHEDRVYLEQKDRHLWKPLLPGKLNGREVLLARREEGEVMGWLRFNYFWDNTPFMNLLWLDEEYRGQGFGRDLVLHWEEEMKQAGHVRVMTSTQADEGAQHFYRKLGYRDAGCLLLPDEPLEIILLKGLA
ncbi:GNAT family N-acetyltransferase [Gorillibacterium sp. CAU 1737]|uniref:GNAT family N-acetyltransferase n=1 Tax=Gorillibacterium sp. CAU 1737 TaxID=3140362 RepID=UPI0032605DFB